MVTTLVTASCCKTQNLKTGLNLEGQQKYTQRRSGCVCAPVKVT